MVLRVATFDDAKQLFDWANDPTMRANSFEQNKIDWNEHLNWLRRKLSDANSLIFIATIKDEDIGQIRFDRKNNDAFIDFFIDAKFRGKGLGTQLLIAGCKEVIEIWKDIENIFGQVKQNNPASGKAFIKAGFNQNSKSEDVIVFRKTF